MKLNVLLISRCDGKMAGFEGGVDSAAECLGKSKLIVIEIRKLH